MKKVSYFHTSMFGESEQLKCSICGEEDRSKLVVELIGIAVGMGGEDFSFCKKCWKSEVLGEKLFHLLGFEKYIKLEDDLVEVRTYEK